MPFPSDKFDILYCSHFFEHIPRRYVQRFLSECRRVIKPGGLIRLVMPDSEEMFATYLELRSKDMHLEADFVMMEIIDQCVRDKGGGEFGAFFSMLRSMNETDQSYWHNFVVSRWGSLDDDLRKLPQSTSVMHSRRNLLLSPTLFVDKIRSRLRSALHRLGLSLLNPSFLRQNVSLAGIGEKHCWLWDFYQLKCVLESAGFTEVCRQTHLSSHYNLFPFYPLDATAEGAPRKGKESMFVEALVLE